MSGDDPGLPAAAHAAGGAVSEPAPLGPGVMLLVVGPSGAGKDTLLDLARARFAHEPGVLFARRLVTRPPGAGEAHGTLSEGEFEAARAAGHFPLCWRAHGLAYALGPEVGEQIRGGGVVVANGSRATLIEAGRRFARLAIALITAPPEVRAARLAARGRESAEEILERLARQPDLPMAPDLVIENVGPPVEGGARLAQFIAEALADTPTRRAG